MSEDIGVKESHTLKKLGPGLITGASNSDPSSIATFSQSGAQFGYGQLWIILFLYPLLFAVQELSPENRPTTCNTFS
jgi:Mn2+/Fe2+ NRAMP family transporter